MTFRSALEPPGRVRWPGVQLIIITSLVPDRGLLRPIVFTKPVRAVTPLSWIAHVPFAFWLIDAARPSTLVELGTHFGRFSTLVRATFDEARGQFADGSIDLLDIDGLHTYEAVRHEFDTWLPKMSSRGIILPTHHVSPLGPPRARTVAAGQRPGSGGDPDTGG